MLKKISIATALFFLPACAATAQSLEDIFAPGATGDGVLPIEDIVAAARSAEQGDIVEIELEREKGRWIYEVEVISKDRQKIELKFDARNAQLLSRRKH